MAKYDEVDEQELEDGTPYDRMNPDAEPGEPKTQPDDSGPGFVDVLTDGQRMVALGATMLQCHAAITNKMGRLEKPTREAAYALLIRAEAEFVVLARTACETPVSKEVRKVMTELSRAHKSWKSNMKNTGSKS